jgi:FtsP/CotA-like multicopper oxidase with cupredoxin domain
MCEFRTQVLPPPFPPTWTWGYIIGTSCPAVNQVQDTYIGPVLVNFRGTPTTIRYTNSLPLVSTTNVLAYKYSTDQTLHWADPLGGEQNMCHMMSGDPPQYYVGIPAFGSECSLNFGESPRLVYNPVGIPAVPHLHGGEVPPVIDGGPDAWFTSDGLIQGHDYYTNPKVKAAANEAVYSYPNTQTAAPLWFHDHTLGATRLNVYAGIAGAYYLLDSALESYLASIHVPPVTEVIPLVLQDRQFDTDGQFYFPQSFPGGLNGPPLNPQHPYWNPEFIGDTIVVNGKAWPNFDAQPRRYRVLFLNGSNARTYELFFTNPTTKAFGPSIWVIGNDGGFLDRPQEINPNGGGKLVIMPGERYEAIIDFSGFAGQTLVLHNVAKAPYPGGLVPGGTTTGRIVQVRVGSNAVADASYDPRSGIALRPQPLERIAAGGAVVPGVSVAVTRELTLNEVALDAPQTAIDPVTGLMTTYPGGPFEVLVNNTKWSGQSDRTYGDFTGVTVNGFTELDSEFPTEGTTEVWEIVNTTADAHPIHTHLTTFQILSRQNYDVNKFLAAYGALFPAVNNPVCTGGVYCPAFGPPLPYGELSARTGNKLGGNPDVTPFLQDGIILPGPQESGWKDTLLVPPGMVTRFAVRYAPTDKPATAAASTLGYPFSPNDGKKGSVTSSHGYVWHCHIIDHEDNEMMRPYVVQPNPFVTRTYLKGVNY